MDPATQAHIIAINTMVGSPAYELAASICRMRNLNPEYPAMGSGGLNNWQAVIAETIFLDELEKILADR